MQARYQRGTWGQFLSQDPVFVNGGFWRSGGGDRRVAQKVHLFVMDLPQSDAGFVKAYPGETTEAFLDGHVSAFAFFGGVPRSILWRIARRSILLTRRPTGGEPVAVRVIARRPDTIVGFGETRIHAETVTFELRASEVASPPPEDQLREALDQRPTGRGGADLPARHRA